MTFFLYYLGLLVFALNGLLFLGRRNQNKYAELIVLEYVRSKRQGRGNRRGRRRR